MYDDMFPVVFRLGWDGVSGPQAQYDIEIEGSAKTLEGLPQIGDEIAIGGDRTMRQVYKRRIIYGETGLIERVVIRADNIFDIQRREREKRQARQGRGDR